MLFDYFENSKNPVVKMTSSMKIGDIIYIYIGSPYSCIKYKCIIRKVGLDYGYNKMFCSISLVKTYTNEFIKFDIMKKHGVTAVRGARRITKELSDYINQ